MGIEIQKDNDGNEFVPVPVSKIEPDKTLESDIYLRIDNKFIKYKPAGEEISGEKINFLLEKEVLSVFVAIAQLETFMNWLKQSREEVVNEMVEEVGEEYREVVEKREDLKEKVYETFANLEMDSGIVEVLQNQVNEFVAFVSEEKIPKQVLANLMKHNESIADHSVNTANLSVFLAMVLGHGNHKTLEDIYMGALFHDYGKAKIPQEVLENKANVRYNQAIQDHPNKGCKIIKNIENISPAVIKIVQQHHEQYNGNGFPKGLKNDEIFGLAKIVSIANIFDNTVVENKHKAKKEKYRQAIKVIEYDKGKQFDPDIVEKVIESLKLGYGEYYKPPSNVEKAVQEVMDSVADEDEDEDLV